MKVVLFLILALSIQAHAQANVADLAPTAKKFFDTWLVRRDVDGALAYISRKPVLGKCMMSDELEAKTRITRRDILATYREAFRVTLVKVKKSKKLSELVTGKNTEFISTTDADIITHPFPQYFSIFKLKPIDPADNGYVCKFDERKAFQEAISSPKAYYLLARMRLRSKFEPFVLITVWIPEGHKWRILTISVTTDDN